MSIGPSWSFCWANWTLPPLPTVSTMASPAVSIRVRLVHSRPRAS